MLLELGHIDGSRFVHLTHTTLLLEGLCGELVAHHGEPDLAVMCDECVSVARAAGVAVSMMLIEIDSEMALRLAA